MSIEDFFYSTVNIEAPTYTKDAIGGRTLSWTTTHEAVRACIQPRPLQRGGEGVYAGREAARTTHVMYVRYADVSSSMPIEDWRVLATAGPTDGTYNIRLVRNIDEMGDFVTIDMDLTR